MKLFDEKGWLVPGLSAGDRVVFLKERNTIKFTTQDNRDFRIGDTEPQDNQVHLQELREYSVIMHVISLATGLAHRLVENTPSLMSFELYNWPA